MGQGRAVQGAGRRGNSSDRGTRASAGEQPARREAGGSPDASDPMVRLLAPDGTRIDNPDYPLELSDDDLRGLLRDLTLVRRIDAEAVALQRQGELGLWPSLLGQEGAQIGAGRALRAQDMVFPSYREHGVAWCRAIDPLDIASLFRGNDLAGGWDPAAHGFNLYTLVVGSQSLHSVGYAMGVQRDGAVGSGDPATDTAVLSFFGDGATSQGDVNEAFVWAASAALPVVFFVQNNQWAISVPVRKQSRIPLYRRAAGFGFPGIQVDGNDVLACLAVTAKALDEARAGQGPTLIEAVTYRMGAHTTSDDPTRYRTSDEDAHWAALDPIARLRAHLDQLGLLDEAWLAGLDAEADALARRLREDVRALPALDPLSAFDNVYAEPSAELLRQRQEMEQFLASFEDDWGPSAIEEAHR
jgi:pyruvate dehydrogenase E1 component alpha subunit